MVPFCWLFWRAGANPGCRRTYHQPRDPPAIFAALKKPELLSKIWMRPVLPVTHFLSTQPGHPSLSTHARLFSTEFRVASTGGVLILRAPWRFQASKDPIAGIGNWRCPGTRYYSTVTDFARFRG